MTTSDARKRLDESIDRLERTRTHSIDPDTGQFTRLDQETDTMTDLPRTVITLTGDRGPLHVAKGVLVNGSPVTVAEDGVDIDFGPDEVTTVTLTLLADEVHFVKEAPTETGKPELEWLAEPVPVPHPDEALAKVLNAEVVRMALAGDVEIKADIGIAFERNLARAARQHIAEEGSSSLASNLWAEREQAEAEREADEPCCGGCEDCACGPTRDDALLIESLKVIHLHERARRVHAEAVYADATKERDALRERLDALRADISEYAVTVDTSAAMAAARGWLIDRDDARADDQS